MTEIIEMKKLRDCSYINSAARRLARCGLMACLGIVLSGIVLAQPAFSAEQEPDETKYTIEKDIFYLPGGEEKADDYAKEKCLLNLYLPKGAKDFPTVVFIHGGGMWGGYRYVPKPLQKQLKNRDWAIATIGYRLHPKVRYPTRVEDCAAGLAWVFKNIESRGGDTSKIFVAGFSAGGYLVGMVGLDKKYLAKHGVDANRIAGLMPLSGQMITHQTVRKEQGIEPSRTRPTIDEYAPLYHIRRDSPPTLCITGGWGVDELMRAEENLYFVSMMKLIGHKDIKHVVIEGANHGECHDNCWGHVTKFIEEKLADKNSDTAK